MMIELSADERRALRARAHGLNPVVSISENGLSANVLKEIEASLAAHELIKIRVYGDDREQREAWLTEICTTLGAAPVQHIGKLLVVWKPAPPESKKNHRPGSSKSGPRTTKRSMQGSSKR